MYLYAAVPWDPDQPSTRCSPLVLLRKNPYCRKYSPTVLPIPQSVVELLLRRGSLICRYFQITSPWVNASLAAQMVKNPSAMQETWAQSLGCEEPLEKGMAIHSSMAA